MIASRIQQHFQEFQDTKNESDVKGFFALFKKVDAATPTGPSRQRITFGPSHHCFRQSPRQFSTFYSMSDQHLFGLTKKV